MLVTDFGGRAMLRWACLHLMVVLAAVADPSDVWGQTERIDALGVSTAYRSIGIGERTQGQPVFVLFSGAGSPISTWRDLPAALSQFGPVLVYDRPGIGASSYGGVEPTPTYVSEHLEALLASLGIEPPYVLVGHSWGGVLLHHFAARRPDAVVGAVFLDSPLLSQTPAEWMGADSPAEAATRVEAIRAFERPLLRGLPEGVVAEKRVVDSWFDAWPAERQSPGEVQAPSAMVVGTRVQEPSPESPIPEFLTPELQTKIVAGLAARAAMWAARAPRRTLFVSSDSGHFVHWDVPGLVLEAVEQVMRSVGEDG